MFLKSTVRPDLKPDDVDPSDKRALPDENAWVYKSYESLKESLEKAIKPLEVYIKTYGKYEKEYKLDPEGVIKKLDDDDNPPDID
jgi:dynein heavy chain